MHRRIQMAFLNLDWAEGAADGGLYCAATLFTSRRLTKKVLQAMCTSQMCQEITASNPLMTVRCACVQYITAFILIWIICLTHLPKKKKRRSYIYTFLTCFDLFLHERDAARGGFNCQRNHVNILNGPELLLIIWMYRQSAALQRIMWLWVRREIWLEDGFVSGSHPDSLTHRPAQSHQNNLRFVSMTKLSLNLRTDKMEEDCHARGLMPFRGLSSHWDI